MRVPRFTDDEWVTMRSCGTPVYAVGLAVPPFQGLASSEPYYEVVDVEGMFAMPQRRAIVAESDLAPVSN
jgi:hypothetical protein